MSRFGSSIPWIVSGNVDQASKQSGPPDDEQFDCECDSIASVAAVVGGRSYFLPLHYTPSYRYPVIVWLHCDGFNEHQIDDVMPHINLRNYIGVSVRASHAADAAGHRFNWHHGATGIAFAHETVVGAIEEAEERFSVHESRIVLAGYRSGGTMALRIAMRDPYRFAGAISLGGAMPRGAIRNFSQLRRRRLPMLWQWAAGRSDYTAETVRDDCRLALDASAQVELRQYPGDDEMDTVVLRDLNEWMMRRIVSDDCSAATERWATGPTTYSAN